MDTSLLVLQYGMAGAIFATVGIFLKHMRKVQRDMQTERDGYLSLIGNHMEKSTRVLSQLVEEIKSLRERLSKDGPK